MQTYTKILQSYQKWLSAQEGGLSKATLDIYQRVAKNLLRYLGAFKIVRLNDVDSAIILQFAEYKADKKPYAHIVRSEKYATILIKKLSHIRAPK